MRVTMRTHITGLRNGVEWPDIGETIELPDHEADDLIGQGYVRLATAADPAPRSEHTADGAAIASGEFEIPDKPAEVIDFVRGAPKGGDPTEGWPARARAALAHEQAREKGPRKRLTEQLEAIVAEADEIEKVRAESIFDPDLDVEAAKDVLAERSEVDVLAALDSLDDDDARVAAATLLHQAEVEERGEQRPELLEQLRARGAEVDDGEAATEGDQGTAEGTGATEAEGTDGARSAAETNGD